MSALDRLTPARLLESFYNSRMEIFCMIDYNVYSGGVLYFRWTKQGLYAIDRDEGVRIPVQEPLVTPEDYINYTMRHFL